MSLRLEEKLATRRQQRVEDERIERQAFSLLKEQRQQMVQKVLSTQPDLNKE